MAVRAACARAIVDIFQRRIPLTALSVHSSLRHERHLVSVSQHFLSPQPPKKPPGAFLKFMTQRSAEITRINPDASIGDRSKIASQMWHSLDPEERNRLKMNANEELQVYREKYLVFLDGLNDQERDQFFKQKKAKRISRANRRHKMELKKYGKPKMPANAFMLFVRSSRLERGNTQPSKFIKELTEYWKIMPPEEKEIYQEDARLEKEKYQQDMAEWEERMREMGREDLIRRKSQKKTKKVTSTKAKKRKTAKKGKAKTKSKSSKQKSSTKASRNTKKRTVSKEVQTEE